MTYLLHNIGPRYDSNYTPLEDILSVRNGVLTFDGVYSSVYEHAEEIYKTGNTVILFITGDYVGKDNSFDKGASRKEQYCTWDQIIEMRMKYKFQIGWHTWSHVNLCGLTDSQIVREIIPPFPMDFFAYPYGVYDEKVLRRVSEIYSMAFSVFKTDGSNHTIPRKYL